MIILHGMKGEVAEGLFCHPLHRLEGNDLIILSVVYPDGNTYPLSTHVSRFHEVEGRRQEDQPIDLTLMLQGKDRGHEAAETGTHKPYPRCLQKDLVELLHPLPKTAPEIGHHHVRELFLEEDRLGALITALESVYEDLD